LNALHEGLILGLVLSVLAGPILFALIQTGIEQGFRAGMMIVLGVFMSDLLFVISVYFGLSYILALINLENFDLILGLIGGIILILIGFKTLLSKVSAFPEIFSSPNGISVKTPQKAGYLSLWSKGFAINSLNPFTFFFWGVIATAKLAEKDFNPNEFLLFFGGILFIILATDTLKVILAKSIRKFLKPKHLLWMRKIVGIAFIIFGLVLIYRVMV
jgi:threonine/homoserine/homoserine lactone efflux protein